MSLDKRLKEILMEGVHDIGTYAPEGIDPETVDDVLPAIKQAFIDEGWGHIYTPDDEQATQLMTGPEWLARYIKEVESVAIPYDQIDTTDAFQAFMICRDAARRASGVDE